MDKFWTWQQLHDRGIFPSRQHTRRLIAKGIIPRPFRLGDPEHGRLAWRESDIEGYIAQKGSERDRPRPRLAEDTNIVPMRRGRKPGPQVVETTPQANSVPKMILRRPTR